MTKQLKLKQKKVESKSKTRPIREEKVSRPYQNTEKKMRESFYNSSNKDLSNVTSGFIQ